MKDRASLFSLIFALLWGVLPGLAIAQDESDIGDLACDPANDLLESTRYLRSLSLDLRGVVPTDDEVNQIRVLETVPEELIDSWLDTDEFAQQVVRHHRKLIWNNVSNVNIVNASFRFQRTGTGLHWRRNPANIYRGESVPCRDEPAEFGPDEEILTDDDGLEGYVNVVPYWSETRDTIKVCAFDAQDYLISDTGTDCSQRGGAQDVGCGCGPSLRWCSVGNESRKVTMAMGQAIDRLMFDIFREDLPYSELFLTRKAYINGPLSYFWRHQTGVPAGLVYEPVPLEKESLPILPFSATEAWQQTELSGSHAGILTRPAFLLRFQTNRSRANRFYDAFLCQPFNPPVGGLPVADEESARNPDLQHRAGCKYCHSLLEPAASHWGRWTEQGIGFLDPENYPASRSDCEACARRGAACSAECRNFYATEAFAPEEDDYLGMLNAYKFRRDDHIRNIEVGPRLLAMSTVADNRLPQCVARRTAEWLLGGRVDPINDSEWLDELARNFVFNDLSFRSLVKDIVTNPRYRRVR